MHHRLLAVVAFLTVSLAAVPLAAHHVFEGQYDTTKPVHLTGRVTATEWHNPHAFIRMAVGGSSGTATTWVITCGSAAALRRLGITEEILKTGTEITVEGYRYRSVSNWADGVTITLKDGRKLPLGATVVRNGDIQLHMPQ